MRIALNIGGYQRDVGLRVTMLAADNELDRTRAVLRKLA